MKRAMILAVVTALAGCAGTPGDRALDAGGATDTGKDADAAAVQSRVKGLLDIDITDVLGNHLPARVDLMDFAGNPPIQLEVPEGRLEATAPAGEYRVYVHVYDDGVPVLVEIQDIHIRENRSAYLLVSLLEGASGALRLRDFDADGDLAIDRVELSSGTDAYNAAEVPGRPPLPYDTRILGKEARWYRGELHAHSRHGRGAETVRQLVRRAERAGLDFLAITDRNTMAAVHDPEFQSDKLVLIPAMEWGNESKGLALIYGPRTEPDPPGDIPAAQAECIRVQAQGGIFAIAHPCLSSSPWLWGLSYVNAIQVWHTGWRTPPPFRLQQLGEDLRDRKDGRLVYAIAQAAARADLTPTSANTQAAYFYDLELGNGLMAGAIGGSGAAAANTPLAAPVTYIFARDKSLPALLEGLRMGRTYISSGLKGPELHFVADVLADGKTDVGIGGVVPLNVNVQFIVGVKRAAGKKLQVLEDGRPIRTVPIVKDNVVIQFQRHNTRSSIFRVRVIDTPPKNRPGYGDIEVLAMSSPIYAQEITQELLWRNPSLDVDKTWVRIESDATPEMVLPDEVPPGSVLVQ